MNDYYCVNPQLVMGGAPMGAYPMQASPSVYSTGSSSATTSGNNPFGSTGTVKCETCRSRRKKCEYTYPDQPCSYCASHGLSHTCIKVPSPTQINAASAGTTASYSKVSQMALMLENQYPNASPAEIVAFLSQWVSQNQTAYSAASYSNGSYPYF